MFQRLKNHPHSRSWKVEKANLPKNAPENVLLCKNGLLLTSLDISLSFSISLLTDWPCKNDHTWMDPCHRDRSIHIERVCAKIITIISLARVSWCQTYVLKFNTLLTWIPIKIGYPANVKSKKMQSYWKVMISNYGCIVFQIVYLVTQIYNSSIRIVIQHNNS